MSEDPTRILPNDNVILQQILTEVRSLNARVQSVKTQVGELRADVRMIDGRLTTLEDKFDARSRETQPMSGRIDQLIAEVAETRQEVRAGLAGVREELREHRLSSGREMRVLDRTLRTIIADVAEALDGQDELHERVSKLEAQLEPAK